MIAELIEDFAASGRCAQAWRDHVWDRREEDLDTANRARLAAYETRKAFRQERDEPAHMRAKPAAAARAARPVSAAEVRRVLRAAG